MSLVESAILNNASDGDRAMSISAVAGGNFKNTVGQTDNIQALEALKTSLRDTKNTKFDIEVTGRDADAAYNAITITGKAS